METIQCDVAIVGGGPAGTSAAIRLAGFGHRVLLLERKRFPRPHVGEALSPGVQTQLASLGLTHLVQNAGGIRFPMSLARWDGSGLETRPAHAEAFAVDRGRFDCALMEAAAERGAMILQPARARRCVRTATGWELEAEAEGRDLRIQSRFLMDAAGRSGFMPRQRRRAAAPTFALHAYWRGRAPPWPCVVAGRDHWLWGSPVPGLGFSVMLFVDRDGLRRRRGHVELGYRRDVTEGGIFGDSRLSHGPIRVCDATAYDDAAIAGADFLKIGEAAFALDPLSASGVQKAIATALTGAIVANTILQRSCDGELARNFYAAEQLLAVARHSRWTSDTYRRSAFQGQDPFWSTRGTSADLPAEPSAPPLLRPGDLLELSPTARLKEVATLSADFVEPRLGVVHPQLERPIAYFGGVELAPFLQRHLPATADELACRLSLLAPGAPPRPAIQRLVAMGILSRVGPSAAPRAAV